MDGIPPEIPPLQDFETFERETELELAGLKGNGAGGAVGSKGSAELVSLQELKMEPIEWIWDGFLARGKIHLIAGVPEAGKTTIALNFAATLSSGACWPDRTQSKPGNVLIWAGEDGLTETIKPRLMAMGADPKKIWIVKGARDENGKLRPFNPSTDLPVLTLTAKEISGGH
jgi:putative DNA primase/helicase